MTGVNVNTLPIFVYTRLKTVTSRWQAGLRAGAEFSFPTMK